MDAVRRVYPEDVAPSGYLDRDPDSVAATEPVQRAESPGESSGEVPPIEPADLPGREGAPEPEPAPVRPEVAYQGVAGVHVYTLLFPLKIDGRKLTRLTIHPPALWDIQDWAARRLKTNYELMARMVDMDPVTLGALRWPDVQALVDITTAMLPEALRDAIELSKREGEPTDGRP